MTTSDPPYLISPRRPKAHRNPLSDEIGRAVVRAFVEGGPSSLTEKDLQDAFGVSRPAIREAVKGLTAKGLLERRQGIGIRIRQMTDWNLFDRDVLGRQEEGVVGNGGVSRGRSGG